MNDLTYSRPLVLGGTGYIGSKIVTSLVSKGMHPILLVRNPEKLKLTKQVKDNVTIIMGDASDLSSVKEKIAAAKPDSVIYAIGLLRESLFSSSRFLDYHYTWAKICIDMCKRWEVNRFIYISAYGANFKQTDYQKTKFMGEQYLQNSSLVYTIVRPTYALGPSRLYHFMNVIRVLLAVKITPLINGGNFLTNVVNVNDLANGVATSLNNNLTNRKVFTVGGPSNLQFKELINMVAKHYKWGYIGLYIPLFILLPFARLLRKVPLFPASDEQLRMLTGGVQVKDMEFWHINNITPLTTAQTIAEYKFA